MNIFEAPSFFDSNFHPHSNEKDASLEAMAKVNAYLHPLMHILNYYEDLKIPEYLQFIPKIALLDSKAYLSLCSRP